VEEIKSHSFFQNDQWTFDNLRDCKYYLQFSKILFMRTDYVGNNQKSLKNGLSILLTLSFKH